MLRQVDKPTCFNLHRVERPSLSIFPDSTYSGDLRKKQTNKTPVQLSNNSAHKAVMLQGTVGRWGGLGGRLILLQISQCCFSPRVGKNWEA